MKSYLSNLIPRIKELSFTLDQQEFFIDKPWVWVNADKKYEKFIFKRNGDLIFSINGIVTIGRWEYLKTAKSLLIDRITNKILLNQAFIDNAIMILKQDGIKDENMIFANELIIPDLDIENYLRKSFDKISSTVSSASHKVATSSNIKPSYIDQQNIISKKYKSKFVRSEMNFKLGISRNFKSDDKPINGLRHPIENNTTGWYIWSGEEFSSEADFFTPVHVKHLYEICPIVLKYLGLAPGWRFLIADDYEDVWEDRELLNI